MEFLLFIGRLLMIHGILIDCAEEESLERLYYNAHNVLYRLMMVLMKMLPVNKSKGNIFKNF